MNALVRTATEADVPAVLALLGANAGDVSLFQQPESRIRQFIHEFVLVTSPEGTLLGCAQVHPHAPDDVEILGVSVSPEAQGKGVGTRVIQSAIERASGVRRLWLATAKPEYFARFGFEPMSKWSLPIGVLIGKVVRVFDQAPARWLPALFGRHTFMRYVPRVA